VNLSELLVGLETRIAQAAGPGITLEMVYSSQPVWATADAGQLAEVLEALAAGDREGAAERTRLTVSWDADSLTEWTSPAALPPGRYARITVRDDGLGVDANRQAAIFDPAVSGVNNQGLALARAYFIVRQWGGDISFSSELHRGSSFSIYLPYSGPEPGVAAPVATRTQQAPGTVAAEPELLRESILVVDDEAGIRGLMRKILRREHYQVLEAASAEEALQVAADHGQPFDLLLTDVMLPGKLGPDLARELYEGRRARKVLYISGYTKDEAVRAGEYPPGARFLSKPFTLGSLLRIVRETLDA
jgi:CheY-like chemotaxis protein